ncbi:MAG: hypothetical protein JST79_18585 [Acidobacteria bacterium]|nr:hypothetical protein [Acidobacteriota bacterium]
MALLAILAVSSSLATRVFHLSLHHGPTSVQSDSEQATRQHLNTDAAEWAPPVATITAIAEVSFYPRIFPAGPPVAGLLLDESLYNRPPPSC